MVNSIPFHQSVQAPTIYRVEVFFRFIVKLLGTLSLRSVSEVLNINTILAEHTVSNSWNRRSESI